MRFGRHDADRRGDRRVFAVRLRNKFQRAVREAASRARVTNIFGQQGSPVKGCDDPVPVWGLD